MRTLFHVSLIAGLILLPHAASAAEKTPRDDEADICLKVNKDESIRSTKRAQREALAAACEKRLAGKMRINGPLVPSPTNPNEPAAGQEKQLKGEQKPTGCVLRPDQPGNCGAPAGR